MKWAGRRVEIVKRVVLKHLVLLLLLQKYIYRVTQYSLVGEYASRTVYIGRESEIKILNFKINFFSKKLENQGITVGLNKIKPKYTYRD